MKRLLFAFALALIILSAVAAQNSLTMLGAGGGPPSAVGGMTFLSDIASNCSSGSSCTTGVCTTNGVSCLLPNVSGSAVLIAVSVGTSAAISSAYMCNSSLGCNSANATATFSLCPSSECANYNSTMGFGNDGAYLLSAPSGNTPYITVNLSASQSAVWGFNVAAVSPPSGYSFSALDSAGAGSSSTCTTCTLGAPTLKATDLVWQFNDWNGTLKVGPFFSSPYITDDAGNGVCLDCTTSTAPTITQASGAGTVYTFMALKTSAGSYSAPSTPISIANHALFGAQTSYLRCTPGCGAQTIPSTTSGNLLRILVGDNNDSVYLSRVSGCGTWVVPSGLQSGSADALQSSGAYNLSASSGCTSFTPTMASNTSHVTISYWEIHKTSGSWSKDTLGCTVNASNNNTPPGEALTLTNTTSPHAVFQSIMDLGGSGGNNYYPWTMNGGSPTMYYGALAGSSNNWGSDVLLTNTTSAPQPTWIFSAPGRPATAVCADAYY